MKNLLKVNEKKNSDVMILNQIMFELLDNKYMFLVELLANSAVACSCYIVLNMPSILAFHISHIT